MNWEYLIVTVKFGMLDSDDPFESSGGGASVGKENLQATLNDLGGKGWEAFSTAFNDKGIVCQVMLKRKK